MLRKLTLLATAFLLATSGFAFNANGTIRVEGGLISGTTLDGVRSYKGIPFAAPPVGELRWKAPQPVIGWEGVRAKNESGELAEVPFSADALAEFLDDCMDDEDCRELAWSWPNAFELSAEEKKTSSSASPSNSVESAASTTTLAAV